MARVAIITDSSADLPPEIASREGIIVVPLLSDAVVVVAGGLNQEHAEHSGSAAAQTPGQRAVSPEVREAFREAFTAAAHDHEAVLAILLSSRLGSAYDAAHEAREQLAAEVQIEIVDSRSASLGLGFQALRAAELARRGWEASAIAADLRAMRDRCHVVFSVESLEHLRQSGQIGRSAAMIGEALQLKLLLRIDEGQIVPYERARTRVRAIAELAKFVHQMPSVERCAVLYSTGERDAQKLAEAICDDSALERDKLTVGRIGATIAAQVGPGALGVAVVESE